MIDDVARGNAHPSLVSPRFLLLAAVLSLTACQDCTWFAPDAERIRQIGDHRVKVIAEGTRRFGVDGVGAPHAFGVLWPTIDGYGYTVHLSLDDREEIELGTARFSEERMPTEQELQALADAVEVALSPNAQHLAYRKDATSGWRVLHVLSHGRPFDSKHSDVFARDVVAASALDFSELPSSQAIALAMLASPSERARANALWRALEVMPPGPPWDEAMLAIWPEDAHTQPMMERRARPHAGGTAAFRAKLLEKALACLVPHGAHITEAADVISKSEDAQALRTLDAKLLELYPQTAVDRTLARRARETREDASRAAFRAQVRAEAVAEIQYAAANRGYGERFEGGIEILQALEDREDPPVVFETLLPLWPAYGPAYDWISSHFGTVPPAQRNAHVARARAHAADPAPDGRRAAGLVCRLLGPAITCRERDAMRAINPEACPSQSTCTGP
jgi:hypothetical protein